MDEDAKIVLITHLGRPKGRDPKLKLDSVAKRLSTLLSCNVKKLDDCIGDDVKKEISVMLQKEIILLENLRFHDEEDSKDEKERDEFGKKLADLADIYVDEAFANVHRNHASMTSIPKFIPSCAGLGLEIELYHLLGSMNSPKRPFIALFGGVKVEKIQAAKSLLDRVDKLVPCGVVLNSLLKAKGVNIQKSLIDKESFEIAKSMVNSEKIIWPIDVLIADKFSNMAAKKVQYCDNIDNDWMILGVGPLTIQKYKDELKNAGTIVWSGTIDVFEFENFNTGSKEIAHFIAGLNCIKIIGGGDSAAIIDSLGLEGHMTYVSTGGGASLAVFQQEELPAIKALEENAKRFS